MKKPSQMQIKAAIKLAERIAQSEQRKAALDLNKDAPETIIAEEQKLYVKILKELVNNPLALSFVEQARVNLHREKMRQQALELQTELGELLGAVEEAAADAKMGPINLQNLILTNKDAESHLKTLAGCVKSKQLGTALQALYELLVTVEIDLIFTDINEAPRPYNLGDETVASPRRTKLD